MSALRHARLVHSVPGRVRVRLDAGEPGNEPDGGLSRTLEAIPGIREVRFTPRTGSLVIRYDPERLDPTMLADLARAANVLVLEPPAAPRERPPSQTAQGIMRAFGEVDARLAELSHGRWDLRSVLPFVFGALALRHALRDFGALGSAPWYVFAWYAFDSFWKLNRERGSATTAPAGADTIRPGEE